MKKKVKLAMYGEMPIVKIGKFSISRLTDREDENCIWIEADDGEGGAFDGELFEEYIKQGFNKYF